MTHPVTARYRARDGTDHSVTAARAPEGRWCVVDSAAGGAIVVEILTGHDDRKAQALALARDYAAEQQAFRLGLRDHHPLPPKIEREQRWAA